MVRATTLRLLLPRHVRQFPRDLAVVIGLAIAGVLAASLPVVRESALRVVLGLPFAFLLPGYALTAALFPEASGAESADRGNGGETAERGSGDGLISRPHAGVTTAERALFSFGLSITVVPLVGLALNFTPLGVRFGSLLLSVAGLTVAAALLAAVRRWRLAPDERFRFPAEEWYESARAEWFEPTSRAEMALNAVIVAAVVVALGSGAYAVGQQSEQTYTEFYLLGRNETGALVADDYPTTLDRGENESLVVGIGNHERRTVEYSVIVRLQRVQGTNDSATVVRTRRLDRFRATVGSNETVRLRRSLRPPITGQQLRLQYLLYLGDPPANPTAANAYRRVHLWVNVTDADERAEPSETKTVPQ